MAVDIRNFFGGKIEAAEAIPSPKKSSASKTNKRSRKVLEDSDDDDIPVKKASSRPPAKKRAPTPEGEATTKDDYFGKEKPKRTAPTKTSSTAKNGVAATPKTSPAKSKVTPRSAKSTASSRATPNGRSSRSGGVKKEHKDGDVTVLKDEDLENDDIFAADFKTNGTKTSNNHEAYDEDLSDEEIKPKKVTRGKPKHIKAQGFEDDYEPDEVVEMKNIDPEDDFVVPDDDEFIEIEKPSAKASTGRKRKSEELEEEDEDGVPRAKSKPAKNQTPKKSPAKKAKKEEIKDSQELQNIYDSITLVRPPTPPASTGEKAKFKFGQNRANTGAAPEQGAFQTPEGADNCLAGLSFVFTGLLRTLDRERGQQLVKQYGGKITGAPSSKTSYVVLGDDAGPKKLETIQKNNIKTIDENGLAELIRRLPANGGDSKAGAAYAKKQEAEMDKIRAEAEMMEEQDRARVKKQERAAAAAAAARAPSSKADNRPPPPKAKHSDTDNQLWTVKYAPSDIKQICGNKSQVEVLQGWLRNFPKNQRLGFRKGGKDGSGTYRAVIISGPPGVGKTTAAHLVSRLEGYDVVESNASDVRSKKLVESGLRGVLDTTSLLGYFGGDGQKVEQSKKKLVLIMDEVDGMSAGDRGGVGALAKVCKTSNIPMILICNDRKQPKMRPFDFVTYNMLFKRPTTDQIRSRVMTIAFREGMKLPPPVINALIEGTGADIRQVVNMLSAAKIDIQTNEENMDFAQGKRMSKAWQKHSVLKPWDIVNKILSSGMFSSSSVSTLNDKIELYFNDHEFSSLMLQENYLKTSPVLASTHTGREHGLKTLELVEQAANSISEGDLVDRMIHGSQQQWSLMPTHAVFSFVRPASFVAGSMAGGGGGTSFPSWLGKNSSQGKMVRMLKEIQGHMRLRCSADRHAIRQHYLPQMWSKMVKRLEIEGKDAVPSIIEFMDSYFLTRDDWDAMMELGIGPMREEEVKIETQAKSTFTRLYNLQSHPMPFMKASEVKMGMGASAPKKERPDLEEAMDESDGADFVDDPAVEEEEDGDGSLDISKDKYLKAAKKKRTSTAGKGKKKAVAAEDDEEEEVAEEEEEDDEDAGKKKGKKAAKKGRGKAVK